MILFWMLGLGAALSVAFSKHIGLGFVFLGIALAARVLWHLWGDAQAIASYHQRERLLTVIFLVSAPVALALALCFAVLYVPEPRYTLFHLVLLVYSSMFFWPEKRDKKGPMAFFPRGKAMGLDQTNVQTSRAW